MKSIDIDSVRDEEYVKKNVIVTIHVELEDLEIAATAIERSKAERVVAELEESLAEKKAEFHKKIGRAQTLVTKYKTIIDEGRQERPVACHEIFRGGSVISFRADTGEVVNTRVPSSQELQRHIPGTTIGVLNEAAAAQKANNSQTDDEGDVVANDGSDDLAKKRGKKK